MPRNSAYKTGPRLQLECVGKRGSTIGLAGCGIWLIFVAIFGMGAENRSGMREFQLRAGAGFRVFEKSGCENRKGIVAGYGI